MDITRGFCKLALASVLLRLAGAPAFAEPTELSWYGYFKLDMARDSAPSSHGNYALYVRPRSRGETTPTLNITARETRLGLRAARGQVRGRLEVDFYGVSPENKNALMLRHAYLEMPLGPFSLEAGQSADLISPLVPSTLNYSVAWGAGNVGYRHPQLKLSWQREAYFAGVSLSRNITADLDGDEIADGEASALPAVQGRLGCTLNPASARLTAGVSAHYGRCNCPAQGRTYANWSLNLDLKLAFAARLILLGEVYTGSNMGQYAGAVYNSDQEGGLRSQGGWVNLQYPLSELLHLSMGAGLDRVEEKDLGGRAGARAGNSVAFLNGAYEVHPGVRLGLELSRWITEYANPGPDQERRPEVVRLQGTVQGNF
jgi:hypothetical protein